MHSNHPCNRLRLALMCCLLMMTARAESPVVDLRIAGLADVVGDLYVSVYDSEDEWLGDNALLTRKVDIASSREDGVVMVQIELPTGEYAMSIIYDRNGNGELDTNFIGIPKEPVAVSNNARPRFGPPRYKDAVFQLGREGLVQNVEMTDIN